MILLQLTTADERRILVDPLRIAVIQGVAETDRGGRTVKPLNIVGSVVNLDCGERVAISVRETPADIVKLLKELDGAPL